MKTAAVVVLSAAGALALAGMAGLVFAWSGVYDIGADAPHTKPVLGFLAMARERSIATHSRDLTVPDLSDPQLILKGAGQYAAMCTGCHLAPGMADSELRPGLYPQPPNLANERVDPAQAFWAIKHGIKASAMPAWGGSHDDETMWSMVAFLQKMPDLSAAGYKDIVARAPLDDEMGEGGHHHEHGAADTAGHAMAPSQSEGADAPVHAPTHDHDDDGGEPHGQHDHAR